MVKERFIPEKVCTTKTEYSKLRVTKIHWSKEILSVEHCVLGLKRMRNVTMNMVMDVYDLLNCVSY
jgi:hypothetical protein